MKGLKTWNSTIAFSKASTDTLASQKLKNHETVFLNMVCQ